MKAAWVLVLVAAASAVPVERKGGKSIDDYAPYDLTQAPKLFMDFMKKYNRQYKDSVDTYNHFIAFIHNLRKMNVEARYSKITIDQYTDETEEERWKRLNPFSKGTRQ